MVAWGSRKIISWKHGSMDASAAVGERAKLPHKVMCLPPLTKGQKRKRRRRSRRKMKTHCRPQVMVIARTVPVPMQVQAHLEGGAYHEPLLFVVVVFPVVVCCCCCCWCCCCLLLLLFLLLLLWGGEKISHSIYTNSRSTALAAVTGKYNIYSNWYILELIYTRTDNP